MIAAPAHEPFREAEQQRTAAYLGMYLFLAGEIMLFGAIVVTLSVYRGLYPEAARFVSGELNTVLGTLNTAVLLTSSLFVALAVSASRAGSERSCAGWLAAAAACGCAFLAIKGIEYGEEYRHGLMPMTAKVREVSDPAEKLFTHLYFAGTGLHAFHLAAGIALVVGAAIRIRSGGLALPARSIVVEMIALYWHVVDVVWVFLYPVLYLAR